MALALLDAAAADHPTRGSERYILAAVWLAWKPAAKGTSQGTPGVELPTNPLMQASLFQFGAVVPSPVWIGETFVLAVA